MLGAGVIVFVSFAYIYSKLNQEYRNDRGIMTFIGAVLPSLAAAGVGGILMVVSCYVNKEKTNVDGIMHYKNEGTKIVKDTPQPDGEREDHSLDNEEPSIQHQNVTDL